MCGERLNEKMKRCTCLVDFAVDRHRCFDSRLGSLGIVAKEQRGGEGVDVEGSCHAHSAARGSDAFISICSLSNERGALRGQERKQRETQECHAGERGAD